MPTARPIPRLSLSVLAAGVVALAAVCSPAPAQTDVVVVVPPTIERPGKANGFITLGAILGGLILVVAPAALPAKRGHQD